MDLDQKKGELSERNRKFLEDWKKARERFEKLPPEEQENDALTEEATFVVDPIDGTLNYMRGRRASAVHLTGSGLVRSAI